MGEHAQCHCLYNHRPTVKRVGDFSTDIIYSTDKNHFVEAIKAVTLLLCKILSPVGRKYSLSPPIDVSKIDENHCKQALASLPCFWANR